jgi:hypothetical protein
VWRVQIKNAGGGSVEFERQSSSRSLRLERSPHAASTVGMTAVSARFSDCPVVAPEAAIIVSERTPLQLRAKAWNGFAEACGSSMRSTYGHMLAWTAKALGSRKLRLFEVYAETAGERTKIGQCAIGAARGPRHIFLDRLQLLPEHAHLWQAAMTQVLSRSGPGQYEYGWPLNLEPARENTLAAIPGVTVGEVRPLVVQAVDFQRWASWDDYYRDISENSRRNAKAAEKKFADLRIETRTGLDSIRTVPALIRLRGALSDRKGLDINAGMAAVGYCATIVSCSRYMSTSVTKAGGRELSCYYGAEFGGNIFYLEGASAPNNGGAAWHLLIAVLRDAYERLPKGKFIMGYIDYALHDEDKSSGLLRSRQACRVTDYDTSIVKFAWTAT